MLEVAGNSILSMYNIVSLKVERNDNNTVAVHARCICTEWALSC